MAARDPGSNGRLFFRWLVGSLVGTVLIGVTSPIFVRTYETRHWDTVREQWVLPEGLAYRWRSEGYATTLVGLHGMVGRTNVPNPYDDTEQSPRTRLIALWGDSQAEGVCVSDEHKLWARLEARIRSLESDPKNTSVHILPLAASGQDANDWVQQFTRVEKRLGVTEHLILLTEIEDIECLGSASPRAAEQSNRPSEFVSQLTRVLPDFVIHAAKNLLLEPDTNRLRRLRWKVGPVSNASESQILVEGRKSRSSRIWDGTHFGLHRSRSASSRPEADTSLPVASATGLRNPVLPSPEGDTFDTLVGFVALRASATASCTVPVADATGNHVSASGLFAGNNHIATRKFNSTHVSNAEPRSVNKSHWSIIAERLRASTHQPLTIAYAPRFPVVYDGQIYVDDWQETKFAELERELKQQDVAIVDCRPALVDLLKRGQYPHGFHHGQIGNGHLNSFGYQAIADRVAETMISSPRELHVIEAAR